MQFEASDLLFSVMIGNSWPHDDVTVEIGEEQRQLFDNFIFLLDREERWRGGKMQFKLWTTVRVNKRSDLKNVNNSSFDTMS